MSRCDDLAPLRVLESDLGAIYLENPRPNAFRTRDMHLLAAIAASTAVELDHLRDFQSVQTENERLVQNAYGGVDLIGESARALNERGARYVVIRFAQRDDMVGDLSRLSLDLGPRHDEIGRCRLRATTE